MRKYCLSALLALFFPLFAFAGITDNSAYRDKNVIVTGLTFSAQDASYVNESPSTDFAISREAYVRLNWQRKRTDVSSGGSGATWWAYRVFYKIYPYGNPGSYDTASVMISFRDENTSGTSVYEHIQKHAINNARVTLQVTGVAAYTISGSTFTAVSNPATSGSIPSDIRLELIVHTEKFRDLYSNSSTKTLIRFDQPGSGGNPSGSAYGLLTWNYVEGAEDYDLEWVYIDDQDSHSAFGLDEDPFLYKTPTRITTSQQYYELPLTFPSGIVYFRVRAVGRFIAGTNDFNHHEPGEWSYSSTSGGSAVTYTISTDFEQNKNWQYTMAFAEDGKRKQVMTYYDGSLRSRQSATDITSDQTVIVGEAKYDYEGRGTVAILPTPVYSKSLGYRQNFTLDANASSLFDKDNFDDGTSDQVGNTSGAGKYYSSNGLSTDYASTPFQSYVPDAGGLSTSAVTTDGGYPYVQTLYMRDGTGRVAQQSGVGPDHAMGSGHEVQYFYGTTNATELHRMFGTNVGVASHYKKTMVVDPNGQASVAYSDQEGRTIATALTGPVPQNLVALDSYDPQNITVSLNENNIIDPVSHTSTNISRILNPYAGEPNCDNPYSFSYDMNGVIYSNSFTSIAVALPTSGSPTYVSVGQCTDCKYKLNIKIFDPEGLPVDISYGSSTVQEINLTLDNSAAADCEEVVYVPTGTPVNFSAKFCKLGDYTVIKTLSLDTSGIAADIAAALTASGLGSSYLDALSNSYTTGADISLCDISCKQHCKSLVMEEHPTWDTTSTAFHDAVNDCISTNCGGFLAQLADTFARYQCETILQNIVQQVSPGGVFYDETDPGGSSLTSTFFWERVRASSLTFHNPDGTVMSTPPSMATLENPATFQSQWAYDIAPVHREYCHYTQCVSNESMSAYDFSMANIPNWSTAATSGYLNPLGLGYATFGTNYNLLLATPWDKLSVYTSITGTASDPITGTLPASALTSDPTFGNIWSYAANSSSPVYSASFPFNDANRWQVFRGLYLQIKTNYLRNQGISICPYYTDDYAIVKDPGGSISDLSNSITSQSQSWSNVLNNYSSVCEQNVQLWMDSLSRCCDLDTNHYSQAQLDVIADSLLAWCSRSAGPNNPLGLLTDQAVANGELNHVLTLMNALSPTPPCMSYTVNPLWCASDPTIYLDTCVHDTITRYFVTDCLDSLLKVLSDYVIPTYQAAPSTSTCLAISASGVDVSSCGMSYTHVNVSGSGNYFNLSSGCGGGIVPCALQLKFYDESGTIIPIDTIVSLGNPSFLQNYPCSSCSTTGTFRNIQLTVMTEYGPVQAYVFATNSCGLSFVDSLAVDTCLAMVDSAAFQYNFNFNDLQQECIDQLQAQAAWNAQHYYTTIVNEFTQQWLTNHYAHCFGSNLYENFKVTYKNYEHHYTLYYYDQADNLVRTVPPAGYVPTDWSHFNAWNGMYDGAGEPSHRMLTDYTYNSLNEALTASSPDGGVTHFYYDLKGRIVASQNAKQAVTISGEKRYSYTKYDERSRIKEVGETSVSISSLLTAAMAQDDGAFATWLAAGTHSQIVKTYYDEPAGSPPAGLLSRFYDGAQDNLRSRVSYVEFYEDGSSVMTYASYYSYDVHGNVKEMVNDNLALAPLGQDARFKHLAYQYDLVSGKVNYVSYQSGKTDQFWHRYQYDADNRLTVAETSSDSLRWERDAKYFYYLHGPLGRAEIGHDKVQGIDYAYTLHGWIKGVNSNTLVAARDMGRDGALNGNNVTASDLDNGTINSSNINNLTPQDVFGYTLGYYSGDYTSVGTNNFDAVAAASNPLKSSTTDLFNGNISNWVMGMSDNNESRLTTHGKLFTYDQLNRIKSSTVYAHTSGGTDQVVANNSFASASSITDYSEAFAYDPNGNIMNVNREGNGSTMDDFDYYYKKAGGGTYRWSYDATTTHANVLPSDATNQLDHVDDNTSLSSNYTDDVDDQSTGNYTYDEIGNLISDVQEEIANVQWTVFGKIRKITRTSTSDKPDLEFCYDATGQRVCKIVKPKDGTTHALLDQSHWTYTYYARDAAGNVMAVYERKFIANSTNWDDRLTLQEQDMYGSSRLGLEARKEDDGDPVLAAGYTFTPGSTNSDGTINVSVVVGYLTTSELPSGMRWMTRKSYELSNHLGNVYAVVTDKKIGIATTQYSSSVSYYKADVVSATDYFAFGAPENGRVFNSANYRYGFNGKENDPESVGTGDGLQDYGMRIYNPGLGRFLSVDPLSPKYPWYSPYQFAGNMPILCSDMDGGEPSPDWRIPCGTAAFHLIAWSDTPSELSTMDILWVRDLYTESPIANPVPLGIALNANANALYTVSAQTSPYHDANYDGVTGNSAGEYGDFKNISGGKGLFCLQICNTGSTGNTAFGGALEVWNIYASWRSLATYEANSKYQAHAYALNNAYILVQNAAMHGNLPMGFTDPQTKTDLVNYLVDGTLPFDSPNNAGCELTNDYVSMIQDLGDWLYANRNNPNAVFYPEQTYGTTLMYVHDVNTSSSPSYQQDNTQQSQAPVIPFYFLAPASSADFESRYQRYLEFRREHPASQEKIFPDGEAECTY